MSSGSVALATSLPDAPEWVETRGMLLSGHAEILGRGASDDAFVVRVVHGAQSVVSVVGTPHPEAIGKAVAGCTPYTPVIAQTGNADHVGRALPAWTRERAILHVLSPEVAVSSGPCAYPVRLLAAEHLARLGHLPRGLRHEIVHAWDLAPIAAVFVGDVPMAFCYPCWRTESWWDVSIDTHEPHRRRGLARAAFHSMYEHMRVERRRPVWGATESNRASLALAARIGFVPVGEIVVFSQGHWAFLSGGFEDGP